MKEFSKMDICFLVIVLLALPIGGSKTPLLSMQEAADFFQSQFSQIFEDLNEKEIQDEIKAAVKILPPIDDAVVVDEMAEKLSIRFSQSRSIVADLKRVIEDTWDETASVINEIDCCMFRSKQDEYSADFKKVVDPSNFCYNRAAETVKTLPVDKKVLKKMKDNFRDYPDVKWQHFGTTSGFHVTYPKSLRRSPDNCYAYDPRARPW